MRVHRFKSIKFQKFTLYHFCSGNGYNSDGIDTKDMGKSGLIPLSSRLFRFGMTLNLIFCPLGAAGFLHLVHN